MNKRKYTIEFLGVALQSAVRMTVHLQGYLQRRLQANQTFIANRLEASHISAPRLSALQFPPSTYLSRIKAVPS